MKVGFHIVWMFTIKRGTDLLFSRDKTVGCKMPKGEYVIDEDAYAINLVNEKMIQQGQKRSDLESLGFEFQLSFYKNDIIEYEKDGKIVREIFLSRTMPKVKIILRQNR